jgi:hypothetical protein
VPVFNVYLNSVIQRYETGLQIQGSPADMTKLRGGRRVANCRSLNESQSSSDILLPRHLAESPVLGMAYVSSPLSHKQKRLLDKIKISLPPEPLEKETSPHDYFQLRDRDSWRDFLEYECGIANGDLILSSALSRLPDYGLRCLAVEAVLHRDKWEKFMCVVENIRGRNLGDTKIHLVYHGTAPGNVHNIVEQGFLVPKARRVAVFRRSSRNERDNSVHVAVNGSSYGLGIYSSPNIGVALSYGKERLFVCAIIMDQTLACDRGTMRGKGVAKGYTSHQSPSGEEWIVFNSSQIVPLCVLHLGRCEPKREEAITKEDQLETRLRNEQLLDKVLQLNWYTGWTKSTIRVVEIKAHTDHYRGMV